MIRTTRGDFNGCGAYAVRRALVRQYLNSRARVKNKPSEQTSSQVFRRASPEIYRLKFKSCRGIRQKSCAQVAYAQRRLIRGSAASSSDAK